jgi:tRNA(fMet)-specific endonuclease VapC
MIVDTSILVDVLGNDVALQEKLEKLGAKATTTVITKYELLKSKRDDKAQELLDTMDIYDFDGKSSARSARIYKELKTKGKMINELDILIASIAITHDELLVTRDNDFRKIENLKLLVL